MRRWMIIFGLLDRGIVATYAARLPVYVRGLMSQPWLNGACLLMTVSFVVSGVALLYGRRWAFYLNYV